MKTNLYSVVFLLACSPSIADAPNDSSRAISSVPDTFLKIEQRGILPDSLQSDMNEFYGIIPFNFNQWSNMPKILPGPSENCKMLKLMPEIKNGILGPEKKEPPALTPFK